MQVAMIGLHKRFCDETLFERAYNHIKISALDAQDVVLLVTCNRIELYLASHDITTRHSELIHQIKQPFHENLEKRFYTFMGQEALLHLAQVASGLDSLIEGETDIQHQVKKAYQLQGKNLSADGHFLFQKALHIAKKLRTEFAIRPIKALEDLVVESLSTHLKNQMHLVFVGNSDLNRKICKKLAHSWQFKSTLITEHFDPTEQVWSFSEIKGYHEIQTLENYDGLICAAKDKKIHHLKNSNQAVILDLSRPRTMKCIQNICSYKDLSYFEDQCSYQIKEQKALKVQALDYIQENVKRLMMARLNKHRLVAI